MKQFFAAAMCVALSFPCHAGSVIPHLPFEANLTMPGASTWHFSNRDALTGLEQPAPNIEAGVLGFGMTAPCERCVAPLSDRAAPPTVQLVAVAIHF